MRLRIVMGALAAALAFWGWTGWRPPLGAPPATAEDCVEIGLWSNDWHTSFSLPAAVLPADHPLRRFDPEARHFLVGWGDADFYRSDGRNLWLGAKALLPGGATVMHVIGADRPVEETFQPAEMAYVGVSKAGASGLASALHDSLALDGSGDVVPVADGQHGLRSRFLAATGGFDLFTVCNQWAARALRRAGVGVHAAWAYRGDWLLAQARAKAPACGNLTGS